MSEWGQTENRENDEQQELLSWLCKDSFFEGVEEFVEFEELFVHVERLVLELLDFLGAVGEDEGQD